MCRLLRREVDPAPLADAALNVMRHYRMVPGEARYPAVRPKGVQQARLAPADGMFFGLRCLPSVMTGDWCCFHAKLYGTRDD